MVKDKNIGSPNILLDGLQLPLISVAERIIMKKKDDYIPPLPDNRGRHTWWHDIRGNRRDVVIEDEIRHVPSNNHRKVICLQKMVFPKENRWELRLCYYMIGVKGRTKGKWVFGQFATLLPSKDFRALFTAAKRRGWI
ncbi:MAG: hypothetical protein A2169_04740 [Deltaproteobacteria bacterium RBG_13_47_9]|nr:MAG: hypothetical protein A2169_04740 [Deltaproteobacteria bacterium RBG_13_47_9]